MKIIPTVYSFSATNKQIICSDFTAIEKIAIITNITTGTIIYQFNNGAKGGTLVGTTLTLEYDTSAMSDTDDLQIVIHDEVKKTESGAMDIGNAEAKFRDGFTEGFDTTNIWQEVWDTQGTGFTAIGGNSSWSSYLNISMCPFTPNMEYTLTSREMFTMPVRFGYGISMSQRIVGKEVEVSLVGCTKDGTVEVSNPISSLNISGTVSITSNVATINFATPHGLQGNDRVVLTGNTENRLNVGPVYVTVVTATQITVPCTLANGIYTAGGQVVWADTFDYVKNAIGLVYENATTTNAQYVTRRNGTKSVNINSTVSTTIATQGNASPYTESFRSAGDMEVISTIEHGKYIARPANAQSAPTWSGKWTESLPDEERFYKIRIRVKNLPNISRPIAKITAISKTASAVANVTTSTPHGLVTGQFVQIYGVRDITNFPNLTAQAAVTVVDSLNFQITIGASATASSAGGIVYLVNGSNLGAELYNYSIQSIARTNNILTVTLNTTAPTVLAGEWINLHGMDGSGAAYDGAYKVMRNTGSTLEFTSVGTDFGTINCGGALVKRSDIRIHYTRLFDYTRLLVELSNNRGVNDAGEGIPVALSTAVSVVQSTAGTLGWGWYMRPDTLLVNDIASAAITTTTTTAAIVPTPVGGAAEFNIIVTAVTGTSPTMDVTIEESDDTGTNWWPIYSFPRITTTGAYRTPPLMLTGNRFRYVQTLGGTSPSFTRTVNRIIHQFVSFPVFSQIIDRAINVNAANATTTTLKTKGAKNVQLVVNMGAITTTAPQFKIQWSDDNGGSWYDISTALTAVASATVQITVNNINAELVRAIESVAWSGATIGANGLLLKAFN